MFVAAAAVTPMKDGSMDASRAVSAGKYIGSGFFEFGVPLKAFFGCA
jgi:hypothetical protein